MGYYERKENEKIVTRIFWFVVIFLFIGITTGIIYERNKIQEDQIYAKKIGCCITSYYDD
jgi:hypothetical protein